MADNRPSTTAMRRNLGVMTWLLSNRLRATQLAVGIAPQGRSIRRDCTDSSRRELPSRLRPIFLDSLVQFVNHVYIDFMTTDNTGDRS